MYKDIYDYCTEEFPCTQELIDTTVHKHWIHKSAVKIDSSKYYCPICGFIFKGQD